VNGSLLDTSVNDIATKHQPLIVIGNGESRRSIDLNEIPSLKIGCNAVHRDFHVDHLVCIDRLPLQEAIKSNLKSTTIWTREEYSQYSVNTLPSIPQGNQRADQTRHWGSGPYAILLGLQFSDTVHIVGFDLYSKNNLVNNIYKDTDSYQSSTSHAVDPRYWIYQISRIFLENTDKYFVVYNLPGWVLPKEWCLANVEFKTLDNIYHIM
jgi:hypothetical protein